MPSIREVKLAVLGKIKPSKEEEKKVSDFVREAARIVKTVSGVDCAVCGSTGKFTWLKGDHDIDMFMLFPLVPREELEKKGLEFGKRIAKELKGKAIIKYAEHPYTRVHANGFEIDIVPCYRIKKGEAIMSAVDRSPLHLEYVIENLDPARRDEVRLLKQFCKGISVYGSDTKNMGFSGYICELLVIKYGAFENVMESAAKWTVPVSDGKAKPFSGQVLTIIDPTDEKRNAAANVSAENVLKFIARAGSFLKKPEEGYFFPQKAKPLSRKETSKLQERKTRFIAITMKRPDVIDDTLYPQLRRALKRMEGIYSHNDFALIRGYEYADEKSMALVLELEIWDLPQVKKMVGPPVFSKKHSEEFLGKYSKDFTYIDGLNWAADKKRDFRNAAELLKSLLRKKPEGLEMMGIPGNVAREFARGRILEHASFWNFVKKNEDFSAFLRKKYFEKVL